MSPTNIAATTCQPQEKNNNFNRNRLLSRSLSVRQNKHRQLVRLRSLSLMPLPVDHYNRDSPVYNNTEPSIPSILGFKATTKDKTVDQNDEATNIDGGWAWVVMSASFIMIFMVDGIAFSYGVFLDVLTKEFGEDSTRTSLVGSVLYGFYLGTGPIASALAETFGYRVVGVAGSILTGVGIMVSSWAPNLTVMIVMYGVVGGTGVGFMYLTSMVITSLYFDKKRALAVGVASCGSGIGIFVWPIFMQKLFDSLSWRNCIRIQASLVFVCTLCALAFRPINKKEKKEKGSFINNLKKMVNADLLKCPSFMIILIMGVLATFGITIPFIYTKSMAQGKGVAAHKATWLISMMGITNTTGRLFVGAIISRFPISPTLLLSACSIIGGVLTLLSDFYNSFEVLALYACLFGNVYAADETLSTEILARTIGTENLSAAFGFLCFIWGLSFAACGPIAGSLYDIAGNYTATYYAAGAALIMSGTLASVIYVITRKSKDSYDLHIAKTDISTSQGNISSISQIVSDSSC